MLHTERFWRWVMLIYAGSIRFKVPIIVLLITLWGNCISTNSIRFDVPKREYLVLKKSSPILFEIKENKFFTGKFTDSINIPSTMEKKMKENFSIASDQKPVYNINIYISYKMTNFAETWIGLSTIPFSPTMLLLFFPFWADIVYNVSYQVKSENIDAKTYSYEVSQTYFQSCGFYQLLGNLQNQGAMKNFLVQQLTAWFLI